MKHTRLAFTRYDVAAWLTFAAYASASLAVPVALKDIAADLDFPLAEGGMHLGGVLQLVRSFAMCLSMAASGFMAAQIGNRRTVGFALCLISAGIFLSALSPTYMALIPMLLIAGLGEGIVEGIGTPFVQDIHDRDQGQYMNIAHGFWSFGTLAMSLAAGVLLFSGVSWRVVLCVAAALGVPPILLVFLPARRPYPERSHGASSRDVARNVLRIARTPRFWLYFAAIFFAGGGEYCLTFWCASFVQLNFASTALMGAIGTAAFSAGMLAGRTAFGALVPQRHLKRLIVAVGVFGAAVSLLILPFARNFHLMPPAAVLPVLFLILFLCGIGSAPFWPSIQSLTVDRMPHLDSTMAFVILSCAGVPGCGFFTWLMGVAGDHAGLDRAFLLVPASYLAMTALVLIADMRRPSRT